MYASPSSNIPKPKTCPLLSRKKIDSWIYETQQRPMLQRLYKLQAAILGRPACVLTA